MASSDNSNPDRLEALFDAALQISSPAERTAFLERECAGDLPLRQRLEALLRAAAKSGDFLGDKPAASSTIRLTVPITEKPGDKIGRYKLREKIGEGGCGVVYVAEQEEPVRRRVALKVIKLGMDTGSVVARFEAERQALAMMDHPNIAKVLDAGATDTGRPYFVMELVRGIKITEYCDQNNLSTRERLNLFTSVCNAVQHAHQKGIIHRDLKPSNILVTLHDGVPVPKVIDFGIAKATEGRLTDATVYTELHQFIGTPAYMSPEQAEMSGLDIDTRADIYSLGVLLYELLTGKPPFSAEELLRAGVDEMVRTIREKEPMRPSTRLSTMLEGERTALAKRHSADAFKLIAILRGDIDWIVMKCLEKDRTRRYETANGLAADLQRHLNNEPVIARPPSTLYRLQKMARRNKVAFVGLAAVVVSLLIGLSVSTWLYLKESQARQRAIRAEKDQTRERQRAEGEAMRANQEANRSTASYHLAEEQLYQSLVREARATRLARQVGYRENVFRLLKQASELPGKAKNDPQLRREASMCFGDFVGLTPTKVTNFSNDGTISKARMDSAGRHAAFAMSSGAVLIRLLPFGEEVGRTDLSKKPAKAMSFNATANRFASIHSSSAINRSEAFATRLVCLWKLQPTGRWEVANQTIVPGAFQSFSSPNLHAIAVLESNATSINLLDAESRMPVMQILMPKGRIATEEIAASSDGSHLAVRVLDPARGESSLMIWKMEAAKPAEIVNEFPGARADNFINFVLNADGNYLGALTGSDARIYSVKDSTMLARAREYFDSPFPLSFAPEGTIVALPIFQQGRIRLWDWLRNESIASLDGTKFRQAIYNDKGGSLLVLSADECQLFRLGLPAERLVLDGHSGGVPGVIFDPSGSRLASIGQGVVKVWDAFTGNLIWKSVPQSISGQAAAFSPDGKYLVTVDWETGSIRVWNSQTGLRLLKAGTNSPGALDSVRFSRDGRYLMTGGDCNGERGTVEIWSFVPPAAPDGIPEIKLFRSICKPARAVGLEFAPDGHRIAFVERESRTRLFLWDFLETTNARLAMTNVSAAGQSLAFSADSKRLYVMARDHNIAALDPVTGTKLFSFTVPDFEGDPSRSGSRRISLSPDGTKLAIENSSRRGIDFVDSTSGRFLYSLPEQSATIWWLTWSSDNRRLAVSRSNGDITIWNINEIERILTNLELKP